jgi:sugar phosphate isomerase/epimerase
MTPRIGVQLYTVREECERDLPGMLRTIAALGYEGVELFGTHDARELRALLDETGLAVAGRHVGLDVDLDAVAVDAWILGCDRVALSWIEPPTTVTERDAAVARIAALASRARDLGLRFGFHNHAGELDRLEDGATLLERLRDLPADLLWLELDLGWGWWAGTPPIRLLEWARGRTPLVHVKDLRSRETREFCPVGDGAVGYEGVVPKAAELGVEWLVVEQDELDRAAGEALERSYKALAA